MAWPYRYGIQVSSLSPMSALPLCVDESELPFHEPRLPVPGGCLPFLAAHGTDRHCPQPGKASPLKAPACTGTVSGTPCSVPCSGPAAATLGMAPAAALACSPPWLQHHPALPLQACHPWAATGLWAALPAVAGGWGQRGGQETP